MGVIVQLNVPPPSMRRFSSLSFLLFAFQSNCTEHEQEHSWFSMLSQIASSLVCLLLLAFFFISFLNSLIECVLDLINNTALLWLRVTIWKGKVVVFIIIQHLNGGDRLFVCCCCCFFFVLVFCFFSPALYSPIKIIRICSVLFICGCLRASCSTRVWFVDALLLLCCYGLLKRVRFCLCKKSDCKRHTNRRHHTKKKCMFACIQANSYNCGRIVVTVCIGAVHYRVAYYNVTTIE